MAIEYRLSYTASQIDERLDRIDRLANKSELPTKTSDLINDSDFATESYVQEYAQPVGNYALHSDLANKADVEHTHTIESIDGLQDAVNSAADSKFYVVTFDKGSDGEYHGDLTFAEIREKFEAGGNMVARIDGTDYIPLLSAATHQIIFSGIYQATSVALTVSANDVCTLSSKTLSENHHNHSLVSTVSAGFMSSDDKAKLNNIENGAEVNVIESITINGEEASITNKVVNIEIPEQTQVQSDWNQDDETATDYIKNRTHWIDGADEVIFPETAYEVDNSGSNPNARRPAWKIDIEPLVVGETYRVVWDGIEYICEGKPYQEEYNGVNVTVTGIGNIESWYDSSYGTPLPFTIVTADPEFVDYNLPFANKIYSDISPSAMNNPTTVSITHIVKHVHTLSEEFIPDTIARKEYVDEKIGDAIANISSVANVKVEMPITLAAFHYGKWGNISGSTIEEKAQQIARYDVIVYDGALCQHVSMSGTEYERDLALYTKALEYNPDLKVFGYITGRGFANSNSGGHVGMTEYRTSPDNVDHPIWTKEELCAYINMMAHCGGTKSASEVDEFGNPIITGGIPLYGVFFDDWDYHFNDDNTHIMNQGDWATIREKHNFLIDYCHSNGLSAMPNSNPNLIFSNDPTPDSIRNPDGIPSHMGEDDWFCLESYFLRSDYVFAGNDNLGYVYNTQYRDSYKSKCLALTYIFAVDEDAEDNQQIASTFAIYQALCQGVDSIALHGADFTPHIPDEFTKYYNKNNNAVYSKGNGYYDLTVNGHTIRASRSVNDTTYGQVPNATNLATCQVTVDGHVFNNIFVNSSELTYNFAGLRNDVTDKIDVLTDRVEQSSNLYHRAFIDDWQKDYTLADYTNQCFTFQSAFGGEDSGTTSSWSSAYPYNFQIRLPRQGSWRRVEIDAKHLAGKTVELGFESCDAYVEGSPDTKVNITWQVVGVCESNSNLTIATFSSSVLQKSVIDGVSRCCTKFTFPEDIQILRFWVHQTSATPTGVWIVEAVGSYLVDVDEYPIQKTWFTNYAPPVSSWTVGSYANITHSEEDDSVTVNYKQTSSCWELNTKFPADTTVFKAGETWEVGFKDVQLTQPDTGKDLTNKVIILFNLGNKLATVSLDNKSHADLLNMKSNVSSDRFAIARFTVPEDYAGGMSQTPMYVYNSGYVGGDADGLYQLYVKGLYMYKLDERDELFIRGEDLSDTYIGINRVRTDTIDEELEPDSLYIVDDGSMFMTDFRGDRVDINSIYNQFIMRSSTEGSTKKFKITIDDSGTLTSTEIVD